MLVLPVPMFLLPAMLVFPAPMLAFPLGLFVPPPFAAMRAAIIVILHRGQRYVIVRTNR